MKPTQEQVIEWAREAGITFQTHQGISGRLRTLTECSQSLQRITTIVTLAYEAGRKDENEACAKVCEEEICGCCWESEAYAVVEQLAAAIRARREQ